MTYIATRLVKKTLQITGREQREKQSSKNPTRVGAYPRDLDNGRTNPGPMDKNTRDRTQRLLNRGARLLEQGKAAEAIPHLERACQLDSTSVPAQINLGGAYVMAGRHSEAVPLLEAARDAEPENVMIWINLGAAYLGHPLLATQEQQLQAIRAFERALELDPIAPSVNYNLGLIFVDRKEHDMATRAFQRAIQVNPFDRDARTWLRKLKDTAEREERT
jgi:tetratricopeptide (TPR) repeat protein